ncbi:MAG: alpha/beta hydrolase family protein, partial [Porcipelethomonas sp.]
MKISKKKLILRIVVIALCAMILIFCVGSFFVIRSMFSDNFGRAEIPETPMYLNYDDVSDIYNREMVAFKSGENTLTGYIYGEREGCDGLVVISHGLGNYSEGYISETCCFVDKGYMVFAFDNTGSGRSEGEGTMGMAQSVIDLDAALDYVESDSRLNSLPVLLYGHSWGGYAVTAVLGLDHDITAAVSVAGYNTPVGIVSEFGENMIGKPLSVIEHPFIWLNNKVIFGDMANLSAVDGINATDTHVMIIHGSGDETVRYDGASIIAHRDEITNPNAVFKTIDGERNGHNSLFMSEQAFEYKKQLDGEHEKLEEEYGDEIPDEAEKEFRESVDREKLS